MFCSYRLSGYSSLCKHAPNTAHVATQERLDEIGFVWDMSRETKDWDERFEELKRYMSDQGRWPPKLDGFLGMWAHNQRRMFAKKDRKFMAERA